MFRRHHRPATTTTRTSKPSLLTRLRGPNARTRTVKTKTTTTRHSPAYGRTRATAPVHHRRKVTLGDKVSGAMLRLKGALTHRPAVKAAGTRRMHGTDGRGSHHRRAYY
ncbi:hypothetical protein CNMCM8980_003335 [Aspergillus fumigatiaffinis]|uniref:Uncharacterized protein n=1 Tax=Aspergillus fumigatiaffinis TaxID=340414 RepID=A0A8H4GPA2_9EURO|nr:hypothetical protein CNMCM5878_002076 [Aspergillus fumigatiaffinis]KAF4225620.1 hypothetical protein CNMCM6457_008042 [Aspergillus fumigatiaffinis]KAF4243517.1 hypothetical protein CNMCM6805_000911 [Aspergillus fumigatiaffinis]KAF4249515.1 hypothetical protein CNMCM8980_003335 [Aspergillus fumigatiaffinis]